MAVGDTFSSVVGAAQTLRQPASGVEEKITAVGKSGSTDYIGISSSSYGISICAASVIGSAAIDTKGNLAYMINNAVYLVKYGSTDHALFCGVQVNA
mgnify:FL=1